MSWLNNPVPIIEVDEAVPEYLTFLDIPPVTMRRDVTHITTRYVGGDYNAAKKLRSDLLTAHPPTLSLTGSTIQARIVAADGGQYQVEATLTTIGPWVLLS